jgi:hypothetical protein
MRPPLKLNPTMILVVVAQVVVLLLPLNLGR